MKAPLVGGPWGLDRSKPEKGGSLGGWGGIRCTEAARPATTPWRVGTAALRNTLNPKPKTQNPKPKTQNPKPKTQNPKPKTQNPKPKTQNPKPKTQNPKWPRVAPARVAPGCPRRGCPPPGLPPPGLFRQGDRVARSPPVVSGQFPPIQESCTYMLRRPLVAPRSFETLDTHIYIYIYIYIYIRLYLTLPPPGLPPPGLPPPGLSLRFAPTRVASARLSVDPGKCRLEQQQQPCLRLPDRQGCPARVGPWQGWLPPQGGPTRVAPARVAQPGLPLPGLPRQRCRCRFVAAKFGGDRVAAARVVRQGYPRQGCPRQGCPARLTLPKKTPKN